MKIVGVDPGIAKPGIAYSNKATQGTIKTFTVKTKATECKGARLRKIINALLECLPADLLVLEGYATNYSNRKRTFNTMTVAEMAGTIHYFAFEMDTPIMIVSPSSLKKFATKSGKAKKSGMAISAYKESGVEFGSEDECDAYWLCRIGQEIMDPNPDMPKYRREVLDKLQIPDGKKEGA